MFQAMFHGPDYTYAHRWTARIAVAVMTMPLLAFSYGWGFIVALLFHEHSPHLWAGFGAVFLLLLLSFTWVVQWFRGFPQT